MSAPHAANLGLLEEVWEVDVRSCVQIAADVVASVGHVELFEEVCSLVFARAAVLGVRVEVEGVVGGLCEFSVPDDFSPEVGIHGV